MILPSVSLRQPWAWSMTDPLGPLKDIENRGHCLGVSGIVLVHASGTCSRKYYEKSRDMILELGRPRPEWDGRVPPLSTLKMGGIVGAFEIYEKVPPSDWKPGSWHLHEFNGRRQWGHRVRDQIKLPFRELGGHLYTFFVELTAEEERLIRAAFPEHLVESSRVDESVPA